MDEIKTSIPKLKLDSIKLKNPSENVVTLVPEEEESVINYQKRFLHEELNNAFDMIVTDETTKVNYIIFMWDIDDIDRLGAVMDTQEFTPKFQLEPYIADGLRRSIYSRMSLEFADDEEYIE